LQHSAVFSTFLSFVYMSTHIFIPSSVIRWGFYWEIYSIDSLRDCMSLIDPSTLLYTVLNCTELKSPLYFTIQLLEKKCLATCKKVWVMLRVKDNVQLQVTTTWNVL